MGTGYLEIAATTALGGLPIPGARVTVLSGDEILYEMFTDKSGVTEKVALEAPEKELTLDENFDGIPYSVTNVKVEAENYVTVTVYDVEIFDTETSILPVYMTPVTYAGENVEYYTPLHKLVAGGERTRELPPPNAIPDTPRVLSEVVIPEYITVHLGRPNVAARNIRVPFSYYKEVTKNTSDRKTQCLCGFAGAKKSKISVINGYIVNID